MDRIDHCGKPALRPPWYALPHHGTPTMIAHYTLISSTSTCLIPELAGLVGKPSRQRLKFCAYSQVPGTTAYTCLGPLIYTCLGPLSTRSWDRCLHVPRINIYTCLGPLSTRAWNRYLHVPGTTIYTCLGPLSTRAWDRNHVPWRLMRLRSSDESRMFASVQSVGEKSHPSPQHPRDKKCNEVDSSMSLLMWKRERK